MVKELKIVLDNESLGKLLRSNLSCYLGKEVTISLLDEMCAQIMESIDFYLNSQDD